MVRITCVTVFAKQLESGLDTTLATGGEQLSDSERQRIGLAQYLPFTAIIIISHRNGLASYADRILSFRKEQLVEDDLEGFEVADAGGLV